MEKRRIVLWEYDAVGNRDWFLSTPYYPGDAAKGKLKGLTKYIKERRKVVDKILHQEHKWVGEIKTLIDWRINDVSVSFKHFYKSQFRAVGKNLKFPSTER